jgi:hypothetical protein
VSVRVLAGVRGVEVFGGADTVALMIRHLLVDRVIYVGPTIDLYAVEGAIHSVVASRADRMITNGRGELNSGEVFMGPVGIWLDLRRYSLAGECEN